MWTLAAQYTVHSTHQTKHTSQSNINWINHSKTKHKQNCIPIQSTSTNMQTNKLTSGTDTQQNQQCVQPNQKQSSKPMNQTTCTCNKPNQRKTQINPRQYESKCIRPHFIASYWAIQFMNYGTYGHSVTGTKQKLKQPSIETNQLASKQHTTNQPINKATTKQ